MAMNLTNKIVFITGASSGIGMACAQTFAQHGAKLLLCGRRLDNITALAKQLEQTYNITCHGFALDVRDATAVKKVIQQLPTDWQSIDILINNAGLAVGLDLIQESQTEDFDQVIDTNVKGLLYVTRAVLPNMIKRNQGHIINIGSIAGHQVYPRGAVYCASKYAVNAITQGLKLDLLGTSVRVSTVDPGMVETDFSLVRFKGNAERAKQVYADTIPLTPMDVADAVYYCASRPPHVNIAEIIIFPTAQSSATQIHRKTKEEQ